MTRESTFDEIRKRLAGLQLYAIFMRPTDAYAPGTEDGREVMRRHLQWQLDMQDRGVLLGAGPFEEMGNVQSRADFAQRTAGDEQPILNATGMYIVVAPTREAAEAIANDEPFEKLGWRTHQLLLWNLNEGTAIALASSMIESVKS